MYTAQAVSAGLHSCAIAGTSATNAGALFCWGPNESGQLGRGTAATSNYPLAVAVNSPFSAASTTLAVSAGNMHTCVVRLSNGAAYCWGNNTWGQLGDGTVTLRNAPVVVTGLDAAADAHAVKAISARSSHTCAVVTGADSSDPTRRTVKCWGYNGSGQLGDGTTGDSSTPVDVAPGPGGGIGLELEPGVQAVGIGGSHTCTLTTTGTVKCWGFNSRGQLGDGTTSTRMAPVLVSGLSSDVVVLSVGETHNCVLTLAGTVKCWGRNDNGQIGDDTLIDRREPVAVTGFDGQAIVGISAGFEHTCAAAANSRVWCWGNGANGRLGRNSETSSSTPVLANSF